jgi:hypothetical protein
MIWVGLSHIKINYQNPQTSYPRSKLRGITEFCPYGTDFGKDWNPRSKLLGIPIRIKKKEKMKVKGEQPYEY